MSDLEKDVEASRARLDETIDRIQDRLNPASLVDEMLGTARHTPLGNVYDSALETVRRNPVPVLLIAAGVSLLLNKLSSGRPARAAHERAAEPAPNAGPARTYDPDQPVGRPAAGLADETKA